MGTALPLLAAGGGRTTSWVGSGARFWDPGACTQRGADRVLRAGMDASAKEQGQKRFLLWGVGQRILGLVLGFGELRLARHSCPGDAPSGRPSPPAPGGAPATLRSA